jgi:hypothetical protein
MTKQHSRTRYPASFGVAVGAFAVLLGPTPVTASHSDEIAEIKQLMSAMQSDYERRIAELERRLALVEQSADAARVGGIAGDTRGSPTTVGSVTAGNAFNPQISLILDGNLYYDDVGGEGGSLIGQAAQPSHTGHVDAEHEHTGDVSNGFNLRSAELAFTAAVDPYFDASAFLAFEEGGGIDVEEAWFATRALPFGLRLKGGKFLSDFGYLNNKHPHQWDFVDQNVAYLNLLGDHGLQDTGMQLTWLPELPVYTSLAIELLQGEQERVGTIIEDAEEREAFGLNDADNGPRMWALLAKVGPDLGYDHALQIGGSFVHNRQHQEIHSEPAPETGLEGDANLWGLDIVYKYDNAAAYGYRDLTLQAEFLRSVKDLTVRSGDAAAIGARRELTTDGLYVQGVFGFAPRWQAGLRYDTVGLTNRVTGDVDESLGSTDRWSAVLTWTPTEYSRFRMQYSRSDVLTEADLREKFDALWLQFLMSLGTHGAHEF